MQRRDLQFHLDSLNDIKSILSGMKTLALLETRKLTRYSTTQARVVRHIETAGFDLCRSFPQLNTEAGDLPLVLIVIGSERGFCGDFNERIIEVSNANAKALPRTECAQRIAVGYKLYSRLGRTNQELVSLDGATVAEEIPKLLSTLLERLDILRKQLGPHTLAVVFHSSDEGPMYRSILPPSFQTRPEANPSPNRVAPVFHLPLSNLFSQLLDQYLFATLHQIFYASLLAENERRLQHLRRAIDRLEERTTRLRHAQQALRQEEITQEIEIIMLNAESIKIPDVPSRL